MRSFEYFTPTRVVFGKDTHLKVATLLKEQHCKKVLIHYGGHSAIKSGLIDEIRSVKGSVYLWVLVILEI